MNSTQESVERRGTTRRQAGGRGRGRGRNRNRNRNRKSNRNWQKAERGGGRQTLKERGGGGRERDGH